MAWQLDSVHTNIGFAVKHMMVSTVRGKFTGYTGTLDLDTADLTRSRITAEIDAASIDTHEPKRDEHLRSADFFDAANHPKITFVSRRIEHAGGNDYRIIGDLTIRGITREVVLDAEYSGLHKSPWGDTRTGFSLSSSLDRKDFGLTWNTLLETGGVVVADKVKLEIEVEAALQPEPALAV